MNISKREELIENFSNTEYCEDVTLENGEEWHDIGGEDYTCNWYGNDIDLGYGDDSVLDYCNDYGEDYENGGYNASQACCTCGGGLRNTPQPCQDVTLENGEEWYDEDGSVFDCDWYKSTNSCNIGDSYRNYNLVADEACCACGGGIGQDGNFNNPPPTPGPPIYLTLGPPTLGPPTPGPPTPGPPIYLPVDGTYTIQQKVNNRYLDAHTSGGYDVVTRTPQNNDTQLWILSIQPDNTYTIQHKENNRYLDAWMIIDSNCQNDCGVTTRPEQNNDTQLWILTKQSDNTYTIQHKVNDRYLDAYTSSGYEVTTRPEQNNDSQLWILTLTSVATPGPPTLGPATLGPPTLGPATLGPPTLGPPTLGPPTLGPPTLGPATLGPPTLGPPIYLPATLGPPIYLPVDGTYTIQQKVNNRYLDAHTDNNFDFGVVTRPPQNNDTQLWILSIQPDNTYTIQHKENNRYLDAHEVENNNDCDENDCKVVTRLPQYNTSPYWKLTKQSDNTYTIQQTVNDRYLDAYEVENNNHCGENDCHVVTRPSQNNDSQLWILTLTSVATPGVTSVATPGVTSEATPYVVISTPSVTRAATPSVTRVATPSVTSAATPAVTRAATPAVTSAATPSVTSAATPAVTRAATPSVTSAATPAVTRTATPSVTSAATPAVTRAATPAVTSAATPGVTTRATPAVTSAASSELIPQITTVTSSQNTPGPSTIVSSDDDKFNLKPLYIVLGVVGFILLLILIIPAFRNNIIVSQDGTMFPWLSK
jgi:hypothetical protein